MPDSSRALWRGHRLPKERHERRDAHDRLEASAMRGLRQSSHCTCLATSTPYTSGGNLACTLVIHENDATGGDVALRHLERRRDGALGKQPFATAQRQRIDLEPERIDQIMLHERLQEIGTAVHVQI